MNRNSSLLRSFVLSFLAVAALCTVSAPPARSQTFATVSGPFAAPVYVNIYWDSTWDADNPTLTKSATDSLTAAVINSTYMSRLAEYGVTAPRFGGGFLASPSCGATAPTRPSIFDVEGIVNCEVATGIVPTGPTVIYNILMPPATLESDFFGAYVACGSAPYVSYHFTSDPSHGSPYTAIFANASCGNLVDNLTHEMVEAATDPFPPLNVVLTGSGEIADLGCASSAFLSPFGKGTVSGYWSNASQACVNGLTGGVSPAISSVITSGIGPAMTISIKGSGFGALPPAPPPTAPGTIDLAYLAVQNKSEFWEAANALDSNAILAKVSGWTNTQIDLTGFTSPSGFAFNILPLDSLNFVVCNPASGRCSTTLIKLPSAPILTGISPAAGPAAGGTSVVITGSGFAAPIQVKFGTLNSPSATLVSSTEIHATTPASVPGAATVQVVSGTQTSSQETFTYCRPSVSIVSPKFGSAGTQVSLTGSCLTDASFVRFGTKSGSSMQVVNDSQISVKAPSQTLSHTCSFVSVQVGSPELNGTVLSFANTNDRFTYGTAADCAPDNDGGSFCDLHPDKCPRPRVSSNRPPQPDLREGPAALQDAVSLGLLPEALPGRDNPSQYVTRADFALALNQLFDFQPPKDPVALADINPQDLYYPAFQNIQPFLNAYPAQGGGYTFFSGAPVERQEAAAAIVAILTRAGKLSAPSRSAKPSDVNDASQISVKLAPSVATALDRGLLSLNANHEFRPSAFLTRAEFAELLRRLQK